MRYLCLSVLFLVACGLPSGDTPGASQPDADAADDTPPSGCAAVDGMGCACGAIVVGRWHCAGDTPVCVCPMPVMDSGVVRPDSPRDPDVAIPFPCATGSLYCEHVRACVDTSINRNHCGGCGRACASSEMCVRGACVRPDAGIVTDTPCTADAANDPFNCGACGRVCETRAPNARAVCREGVCMTVCVSRAWWDCNNNPLDGCESTDTRRDLCGCVCRDVL